MLWMRLPGAFVGRHGLDGSKHSSCLWDALDDDALEVNVEDADETRHIHENLQEKKEKRLTTTHTLRANMCSIQQGRRSTPTRTSSRDGGDFHHGRQNMSSENGRHTH